MSDCPLVMIFWEDSRQPSGQWRFLTDLPSASAVQCASVGWLVSDGPVKQLAPNMGDLDSDAPQISGLIQIPASCVLKVVKLREPARSSLSRSKTSRGNANTEGVKT